MSKTKITCCIVSLIILTLLIFIILNFIYYPYATLSEYRMASNQTQALYYIGFERCLVNDFDNIEVNFSETDLWDNPILIKKISNNEVIFRSFGLNGINDNGTNDDITVTVLVEDGAIKKTTRHIPGRSFFKYWELYEWLFSPHESY